MPAISHLADRLRGKTIFFDGVFKGDYSLAIVNRLLASALLESGLRVTCHTREKDWQTDRLLGEMPALKKRFRADYPPIGSYDVHLRNTWPPTTHDMVGTFNAYVCFAWEELEFPQHLVERFNRDLHMVMAASHFVRDALLHSGITIPVEVVGEGYDHVERFDKKVESPLPTRSRKRILHVSSCFPRKGPDCLIEAFSRAFQPDDPVELVIKTFPNPDTVLRPLLRDMEERGIRTAPIEVVETSYSNEELIALYRTASMVVLPSRGEGFGLPLIEAMATGVPVVATAYSGHLDFCRPDTAWLVDYKLSPSRAHVAGAFSLWADPSIDDLASQMRAVLDDPDEARSRSRKAHTLLTNHFTWRHVAARVIRSISAHVAGRQERPAATAASPWTMDIVSSWNQRCGIATYASHLYGTPTLAPHVSNILARRLTDDALPGQAAPSEDRNVSRVWGYDFDSLMRLARRLESGRADVLWMQHHPGHFSTPDMEALLPVLENAPYRVRALTLHSAKEALRGGSLKWTLGFHVAFTHSAEDAALLSEAGHRNVIVIPHGFLHRTSAPPPPSPHFTIGTFGFLTPHKNIDRLVVAFALARRFYPRMKLKLLNCVQPTDQARTVRAIVENLIGQFDLADHVTTRFDFIPEDEIVSQLSRCDMLAFPYGQSTETATGAARIAVSADRPILCSRSSVLKDLWPVSHVLKTDEVECIAEALVSLAQNADLLALHDHDRRNMVQWYSYERAAERYVAHLQKLLDGHDEYRKAA